LARGIFKGGFMAVGWLVSGSVYKIIQAEEKIMNTQNVVKCINMYATPGKTNMSRKKWYYFNRKDDIFQPLIFRGYVMLVVF